MTFVRPLFLGLIFLLCAVSRPAGAEDSPAAPPDALRKGDAILVLIEGVGGGFPEYREVVDSAGHIQIPFLGLLAAEGKSLSAIEAEVAEAYVAAHLTSNATVHVTFITHFDPPPDRANLVRIQDPRRPVSATNLPAATP